MFIKICGLSTENDVQTAITAGADALGFVFANSPRRISPNHASALCKNAGDHIIRVAVMHHPTPQEWGKVQSIFAPDWLQTDYEDLQSLELKECMPLPVFRTGRVSDEKKWPQRMLFEGADSGAGKKANWEEAAFTAASTQLILAGGLTTENVARAIQTVRPWGVDVSSGVEVSRGTKDPSKIQQFIAQVRATEQ
jgi:phosphoribosylanthranilate isomerase|tara:strand:+ start:1172 stop:1756 length:585 start_codon:yes stop_codon:yes gene_type:complete